ncbi:MAG: ATP-binding cassette domain-containing protein [Candidatus Eisenbacteria bacterium]|nr:ATP-binding cassette domain-containing protein [Candidatus Eisenbacteria bacterium]
MTENPASEAKVGDAAGSEGPLVTAEGLARSYGSIRAVEDLSLEIRRGEIVGLLGPNGAGKTTTLRMLVGFQVPSRGRVTIAGHDVFRAGPAAKRHLGYLPENPALFGEMQVAAYLLAVGRLKGLSGEALRAAIATAIEQWGLAEVSHRTVAHLSRGFRQRTGLAQATLGDPDVLILDEPTTGLDPNQASDLRGYLRQRAARSAILISTHILAEATSLCSRLVILHRGRVVAEGPRETLTQRVGEAGSLHAVVRGSPQIERMAAERGLLAESRGEEPDRRWVIAGELNEAERDRFLHELMASGAELVEWSAGERTLEDVFRQLTREDAE